LYDLFLLLHTGNSWTKLGGNRRNVWRSEYETIEHPKINYIIAKINDVDEFQ
jgi:hypothetical protein